MAPPADEGEPSAEQGEPSAEQGQSLAEQPPATADQAARSAAPAADAAAAQPDEPAGEAARIEAEPEAAGQARGPEVPAQRPGSARTGEKAADGAPSAESGPVQVASSGEGTSSAQEATLTGRDAEPGSGPRAEETAAADRDAPEAIRPAPPVALAAADPGEPAERTDDEPAASADSPATRPGVPAPRPGMRTAPATQTSPPAPRPEEPSRPGDAAPAGLDGPDAAAELPGAAAMASDDKPGGRRTGPSDQRRQARAPAQSRPCPPAMRHRAAPSWPAATSQARLRKQPRRRPCGPVPVETSPASGGSAASPGSQLGRTAAGGQRR